MVLKIRVGRSDFNFILKLLGMSRESLDPLAVHQDESLIPPVSRNITKLLDTLVKKQFSEGRQLFRLLKSVGDCSS